MSAHFRRSVRKSGCSQRSFIRVSTSPVLVSFMLVVTWNNTLHYAESNQASSARCKHQDHAQRPIAWQSTTMKHVTTQIVLLCIVVLSAGEGKQRRMATPEAADLHPRHTDADCAATAGLHVSAARQLSLSNQRRLSQAPSVCAGVTVSTRSSLSPDYLVNGVVMLTKTSNVDPAIQSIVVELGGGQGVHQRTEASCSPSGAATGAPPINPGETPIINTLVCTFSFDLNGPTDGIHPHGWSGPALWTRTSLMLGGSTVPSVCGAGLALVTGT